MSLIETGHVIRRALHRVEDGRSITAAEATALLAARDEDLDRLMFLARAIRSRREQHHNRISFSKKVFIPLTRLCRDRCTYCTFATTPDETPTFLTPEQAVHVATLGAEQGCKEALFTLGDRPEKRWPQAREWLAARGYASTLDYLRAVSITVIEQTGLLPHLNPGVMSYEEMARLKPVSASMGLMLETTSVRLFEDPAGPHYGSPDKKPSVRLRCIEDAGRLAIPFTTGILIGIGETLEERADSLLALRALSRRYGHIQEVIIQNFRAKPDTPMRFHEEPNEQEYLATIAVAKILFGPRVAIQAPPNLSDERFPMLLDAGIEDWGGVSPVTIDHVNPEKPWPQLDVLGRETEQRGFELAERLCIYPRFAQARDPWIASPMVAAVRALTGRDGFAIADRHPEPISWQDSYHVETKSIGESLSHIIDGDDATSELHRDLRQDSSTVHGDWETLAAPTLRTHTAFHVSDIRNALDAASSDLPLDESQARALFEAEGDDLEALCKLADDMRANDVGDAVTYVVNRNINFTNVCYVGCRFCAFAQRRDDPDAYSLSLDEVADRAEQAHHLGATEVCIQGGIHPDLPGDYYFEILRAIKKRVPSMHIHAFSPMEILNGATRLNISFQEWLQEAKLCGLGTIPGTAAEILDDDVRWTLTKGKLPADTWEEIVRAAHAIGVRSSSTIMYGHVDAPHHWVAHINRLRSIQQDTGGFTEFVPLPFVHFNAPIFLAGKARPGPSIEDSRRMHAIARILLRPLICNIQVSWVKLGVERSTMMLQGGANDFGGTLMEETISRMAGASHGINMEVDRFHEAIRSIGRTPAERSTTYDSVRLFTRAIK
ncbi:MAG: bifunctional FO biosynthesis protein CofGH [Actinomycetota bacterium]